MKENKNYNNETYPNYNNIEQKMNDIVNAIELNFTYGRRILVSNLQNNKNNKITVIDFFKSIELCPNNCENKDYRGLYVFAKENNGTYEYLYTGISRSASQRLNDHINSSDRGSATWAYLMVKEQELKKEIKKFHNRKEKDLNKLEKVEKKELKVKIKQAIKDKQNGCISKLLVTFIPIENDNYFLSMLEPYVAAKLRCFWNSFKTH